MIELQDIESKGNSIDILEFKYRISEFQDIDKLLSAKNEIKKKVTSLQVHYEKFELTYIEKIFNLALHVKDFICGGSITEISNKLQISSKIVARDAQFILNSKEIYETRFYFPRCRNKYLTSCAELVITNKINSDKFKNLTNPILQDIIKEYRNHFNLKRRDGGFSRIRIIP